MIRAHFGTETAHNGLHSLHVTRLAVFVKEDIPEDLVVQIRWLEWRQFGGLRENLRVLHLESLLQFGRALDIQCRCKRLPSEDAMYDLPDRAPGQRVQRFKAVCHQRVLKVAPVLQVELDDFSDLLLAEQRV